MGAGNGGSDNKRRQGGQGYEQGIEGRVPRGRIEFYWKVNK